MSLAEHARDALGVRLWSRQVEILDAIEKHWMVLVSTGDKTGATTTAACAALAWAARGGTVVVTAGLERSLDHLLAREITRLGGSDRERVHVVSPKPELLGGYAGVLIIVDQAHSLSEAAWWAVLGNRCRVLALGNRGGRGLFTRLASDPSNHVIRVSSEEAAETGIPDLAASEWLLEKRTEWGTDSDMYRVRVEGKTSREVAQWIDRERSMGRRVWL